MAEPIFLPAAPADVGEILTLQRAAYVSEAQLYGNPLLPPLVETVEELANTLNEMQVLKAVLGSRIIAIGRARQEAETLHLGRLAVAPDVQGKGIGSRLISALESLAAPETERFELFTGAKSESNLRLYRRCGYTESHRGPGLPGIELVYLQKPAHKLEHGTLDLHSPLPGESHLIAEDRFLLHRPLPRG